MAGRMRATQASPAVVATGGRRVHHGIALRPGPDALSRPSDEDMPA
jgi:hypothetical protein